MQCDRKPPNLCLFRRNSLSLSPTGLLFKSRLNKRSSRQWTKVENWIYEISCGVFNLLPESPVDALGINSDTHFRTESEGAWHAFGDRFLPKDFWEPVFEGGEWKRRPDGKRVGMRVMTVEVHREDETLPGFVRVEMAPSVRITPNGVYVGINGHFQLTKDDERANAADAARTLAEQWDGARRMELDLVTNLLEAV